MCDPSSMRDQGITRNAIYVAKVEWSPERKAKPYETFLRRDGASNNAFYSFGGSKGMRSSTCNSNIVLNPVLRDFDDNVRSRDVITYVKDPLQKVQDYTKNISQSIFSPGIIPKQEKFLSR